MDRARLPLRTGLLIVLLALLAVWAVRSGLLEIPARWNPWAPLRIDAEPNVLTRFKLARASADPALCSAALSQARMTYVPLEDRATGQGCGFRNAVRIERSSVDVGEAFALSCPAALSLAMWERHALQQAALDQLDARVEAIEHFGSYACRNLYGEPARRRRSRHATADALDIAGFVLDDGRRVRVIEHWRPRTSAPAGETRASRAAGLSPEARFLHAVHDGACRYFDVVLGPDYNRAHVDHFHFDRGQGRVCR